LNRLRTAACYGAFAGLIYGLLEYAFAIVRPMVQWRPQVLVPGHWAWEAAILAVYVLSGAIVGSLTAFLPSLDPRRTALRWTAAAAILSLAVLQITTESFTFPNLFLSGFLISAALLLPGSLLLDGRSPVALSWICSPWLSIPLALIFLKLHDMPSGLLLMAATLAAAVVAVACAARVSALRRALDGRFLPLSLAGIAALAVAISALTSFASSAPAIPTQAAVKAPPGRPNVLLIVLDTVRADHLSVYGYPRRTSPNLEALAPEGVLFRNAISSSDITLSSHASLFTGRYTSSHGAHPVARNDPGRYDAAFPTLAEILAANGYLTFAELSNSAYLRPEFGLSRGFRFYDVRSTIRKNGGGAQYYLRPLARRLLDRFTSAAELDRLYTPATHITGEALRIVDAVKGGPAPFFLTLNYMDAHDPRIPPAPYRDLFPGRLRTAANENVFLLRGEIAATPPRPAPQRLAHLISQYDAGIAFMDAEVKRLLDGLKTAGLYDNTLVILTADHGEALGERGIMGHPASVHHELVHVPLWIKYPRASAVSAGRVFDNPVSIIDLMPTTLDVAGIAPPPGMQGISLRPGPGDPRPIYTESFVRTRLNVLRGRNDATQRALYQDSWKLITTGPATPELYNWKTDLAESSDLAASDPALTGHLQQQVNHWLENLPRPVIPVRTTNHQTLERLRGLGYVR
jgi:arylsulfatase A-like enzyme